MAEIHLHDVKKVLSENRDEIQRKRIKFEKYKVMTDLINLIQGETEKSKNESDNDEDDDFRDEETTSHENIQDFNTWAKSQAAKELSKFKHLTDLCELDDLRNQISSLNSQQRKIFDDFIERMASNDIDEPPVYLFIAGEAGTGKSHLVRLLIEAVKILKIKAGDDLKKPPVLVMAPTANAAYIIGGKTIESTLGFSPAEHSHYVQAPPGKMSSMKYQYEDVEVLFIDEISMVGSKKLTKINFRLQDIADAENKLKFMGGKSLVASGNFGNQIFINLYF